MISAGAFALVIVVLVILAMLYYNSQKKVSMYEKKDTLIVKAVNKVNKLSTKFISDKLELNETDAPVENPKETHDKVEV
jgi:hypothetical protein